MPDLCEAREVFTGTIVYVERNCAYSLTISASLLADMGWSTWEPSHAW